MTPAEPPVGPPLPPGCTLFTLRLRPHGLVSLEIPVPKVSPCPSPQTPRQLPPQKMMGTQVLLCHHLLRKGVTQPPRA